MERQQAPSLDEAVARVADALQILVLSVESCRRDLDPLNTQQSGLYAVNARLVGIAAEMRAVLHTLAGLLRR